MRSPAYALLANNAPDSEIREAISPAQRDDIVAALEQCRADALTVLDCDDSQAEKLLGEIGSFIALTGGGWPPEQREEFIKTASAVLADIPIVLLGPAICEARKRVWDAKRFVSWIVEYVDSDLAKMETELNRLERLAGLAGVAR